MKTVRTWAAAAKLFGAALFLLSLVPSAWAAQGMLPPSFGGWTASGNGAQSAPRDLEKIAGDKAGVLREYGITSAEQGVYSQGAQQTSITVYRMVDPSAAFGAFTFLREPRMTPLAIGDAVAYAAGVREHALVVVGNLLLDICSPAGSLAAARPANRELQELAGGLRSRADHAPYPTIAGFLPKAGLVPNSERYVLGAQALAQVFPVGGASQQDWVGFGKSAEAIVAPYHLDGQGKGKGKESLLLIALYPTQQVAADAYGDMGRYVALNPDVNPADGRPTVFGKRTGSLIALVAGAESRQAAGALLDQIQYSSQVTWNEPTHELTDPSIATIVIGAFYGTGLIMVMAVAAGIGFAGFRVFMKFLFPGKIFDRDEQVEILQMGLSAKPIEGKDFYLIDSSSSSREN